MKRSIAILLCVMLILGAFPLSAFAVKLTDLENSLSLSVDGYAYGKNKLVDPIHGEGWSWYAAGDHGTVGFENCHLIELSNYNGGSIIVSGNTKPVIFILYFNETITSGKNEDYALAATGAGGMYIKLPGTTGTVNINYDNYGIYSGSFLKIFQNKEASVINVKGNANPNYPMTNAIKAGDITLGDGGNGYCNLNVTVGGTGSTVAIDCNSYVQTNEAKVNINMTSGGSTQCGIQTPQVGYMRVQKNSKLTISVSGFNSWNKGISTGYLELDGNSATSVTTGGSPATSIGIETTRSRIAMGGDADLEIDSKQYGAVIKTGYTLQLQGDPTVHIKGVKSCTTDSSYASKDLVENYDKKNRFILYDEKELIVDKGSNSITSVRLAMSDFEPTVFKALPKPVLTETMSAFLDDNGNGYTEDIDVDNIKTTWYMRPQGESSFKAAGSTVQPNAVYKAVIYVPLKGDAYSSFDPNVTAIITRPDGYTAQKNLFIDNVDVYNSLTVSFEIMPDKVIASQKITVTTPEIKAGDVYQNVLSAGNFLSDDAIQYQFTKKELYVNDALMSTSGSTVAKAGDNLTYKLTAYPAAGYTASTPLVSVNGTYATVKSIGSGDNKGFEATITFHVEDNGQPQTQPKDDHQIASIEVIYDDMDLEFGKAYGGTMIFDEDPFGTVNSYKNTLVLPFEADGPENPGGEHSVSLSDVKADPDKYAVAPGTKLDDTYYYYLFTEVYPENTYYFDEETEVTSDADITWEVVEETLLITRKISKGLGAGDVDPVVGWKDSNSYGGVDYFTLEANGRYVPLEAFKGGNAQFETKMYDPKTGDFTEEVNTIGEYSETKLDERPVKVVATVTLNDGYVYGDNTPFYAQNVLLTDKVKAEKDIEVKVDGKTAVITYYVIGDSAVLCNKKGEATPFIDVPKDAYYYDATVWAYNAYPQITDGNGKDKFMPEQICTRGQVVTFLWRSAGEPTPAKDVNPFVDVKESDYFYMPVLWAFYHDAQITDGTDATHFSPNNPCKNSHILTFIWRALGEPGKTADAATWYTDAYNWARYDANLLEGTFTGTYDINAQCPRKNVVQYLYRYYTMADE